MIAIIIKEGSLSASTGRSTPGTRSPPRGGLPHFAPAGRVGWVNSAPSALEIAPAGARSYFFHLEFRSSARSVELVPLITAQVRREGGLLQAIRGSGANNVYL
uniref:Uncharacterized protein n=1 Tax=Caulerpa manorensis TaxID=717648 RepID=A0A2P0QIF8_9CHLO|nr:hypothetical protein [Caulerpa manorensis]ARO74516.1 hypothetical protein [Caulerpa manorensis]